MHEVGSVLCVCRSLGASDQKAPQVSCRPNASGSCWKSQSSHLHESKLRFNDGETETGSTVHHGAVVSH